MRYMARAHGRRRHIVALGAVLTGMLMAWRPGAFALNPAVEVSQYAHMAWRIRDGFSKGIISSIAQTPDGYLWLGTDFGLLRFDGVRNVPWEPRRISIFPQIKFSACLARATGLSGSVP